jgi:hypothetical protein
MPLSRARRRGTVLTVWTNTPRSLVNRGRGGRLACSQRIPLSYLIVTLA